MITMITILTLLILVISSTWAWPIQQAETVPWKDIGSRMINGEMPRKGYLPWQAAIFYETDDNTQYFCGGSLIAPEWVLTAAQCADGAVKFSVQLGSLTLLDEDPDRTLVTTNESYIHPNYSSATLENDIAIIKIPAVELTDVIQPVNLTTTPIEPETRMTMSGFGKTSDASGTISNLLQYIEIGTIENEECAEYYGDDAIKENMVCAIGRTIESVCNGDSGGPAVANIRTNPTLVAIISFTSSLGCEAGYPSGCTRVYPYLEWINEVIGI